jgi:hypothetical protein
MISPLSTSSFKDPSTKNGRILAAPFQNTVLNGSSVKNGNKAALENKKSLDFRTFTFKALDKAGNVRMNNVRVIFFDIGSF